MGVFHVFKIVQRLPNHATHHIYSWKMEDYRESFTYLYIPLSNIDDEVSCENN